MADDNASFMITHLLTGLGHAMPADQQANLVPYQEQAAVAGSDPTVEWHRAFLCARWAKDTVDTPEHGHLRGEATKALEVVKEIEKTIGGELTDLIQLKTMTVSVSPKFEVELTWVYEAVHVAANVADEAGWDAVPWAALVSDMLSTSA